MWAPVRHATPVDPSELPACLCGLLRRAVEDAMAVEEMPGYKLNMGVWHMPNGVCQVCMAGAVMARTLKVERDSECEPTDLSQGIAQKLYAVNCLRAGNVLGAFGYLHRFCPGGLPANQNVAMHTAGGLIREDFLKHNRRLRAEWKVYLKAADLLEAVGL